MTANKPLQAETINVNGSEANKLPLLSVIILVFTEQALLENHLTQIIAYLQSTEDELCWEVLIVNDGSLDNRTAIADTFASHYENVFVLHHPRISVWDRP